VPRVLRVPRLDGLLRTQVNRDGDDGQDADVPDGENSGNDINVGHKTR